MFKTPERMWSPRSSNGFSKGSKGGFGLPLSTLKTSSDSDDEEVHPDSGKGPTRTQQSSDGDIDELAFRLPSPRARSISPGFWENGVSPSKEERKEKSAPLGLMKDVTDTLMQSVRQALAEERSHIGHFFKKFEHAQSDRHIASSKEIERVGAMVLQIEKHMTAFSLELSSGLASKLKHAHPPLDAKEILINSVKQASDSMETSDSMKTSPSQHDQGIHLIDGFADMPSVDVDLESPEAQRREKEEREEKPLKKATTRNGSLDSSEQPLKVAVAFRDEITSRSVESYCVDDPGDSVAIGAANFRQASRNYTSGTTSEGLHSHTSVSSTSIDDDVMFGPDWNGKEPTMDLDEQMDMPFYLGSHAQAKKLVKGDRAGTTFFRNSLLRKANEVSVFDYLLKACGCTGKHTRPDTWLAKKVEGTRFNLICTAVTLFNCVCIGWETDQSMRCALATPPCQLTDFFRLSDFAFAAFFTSELILRICAHGFWFFVSPADWRWNMLDIFLVLSCLFSTSVGFYGETDEVTNVSFVRLLRVFRIVRAARIIRVARFFTELRTMMFSIMACMASLAWSFGLLLMIMFMFSAFLLQGAARYIKENDYDENLREEFGRWFPSLYDSMFSLLVAILGGADWLEICRPLTKISEVYKLAFALYMVFVVVGVLNILTAVFLESASELKDRDLIVQNEMKRMDAFVEEMLELFHEIDPESKGIISRDDFVRYIGNEEVQAYLASHMLDTTHADMLYQLLDHGKVGSINIHDFIQGLLRIKGGAKELDTRVLIHEVRRLKLHIESLLGGLGGSCSAFYS